MNRWIKAAGLAAVLAAGACGRAELVSPPAGARRDVQAPPADSVHTTGTGTAVPDSTDTRWGGFIGSGT